MKSPLLLFSSGFLLQKEILQGNIDIHIGYNVKRQRNIGTQASVYFMKSYLRFKLLRKVYFHFPKKYSKILLFVNGDKC